jgi:pimeloyl-ACP methyl ester carboxylesterase
MQRTSLVLRSLGLACVFAAAGCGTAPTEFSESLAALSSGSRTYTKTFDGESFTIETYKPSCSNPDILIVNHGSSRNTYMSGGRVLADRECLVIVAPIFPDSRYSSRTYQRGGIVNSSGSIVSSRGWTTRFEEAVVEWALSEVSGSPDVYLFGFSAGGQFLSRVAAYDPVPGVRRYVVSSPSTHVLPSLTEDVPYGFDGFSNASNMLRAYLALPLTILVGEDDDDPNSSALAKGPAAMRQGEDRLERAINTFERGEDVAQAHGWTFNWRLVIASEVAHSGSSMLRADADELESAFGFDESSSSDSTPPTIKVISPANHAELQQDSTITLAAEVKDHSGLERVELVWHYNGRVFTCGSSSTCSRSGDAYSWRLFVGTGERRFQFRARDNAGNTTTTTERTISLVSNPSAVDTTPPSITMTYPQNGASLEGGQRITVSAIVGDNVGLDRVSLEWDYNGRVFECGVSSTCSVSGDTFTWRLTVGTGRRDFRVTASDEAGNEATSPDWRVTYW